MRNDLIDLRSKNQYQRVKSVHGPFPTKLFGLLQLFDYLLQHCIFYSFVNHSNLLIVNLSPLDGKLPKDLRILPITDVCFTHCA